MFKVSTEVENIKQRTAKPQWSQAVARKQENIHKKQEETVKSTFTSENKHNGYSGAAKMRTKQQEQDKPLQACKLLKKTII